ncbi:MAG: hypothetical protein D6675_03170, partial [Gemmatimonadetes bacterium]
LEEIADEPDTALEWGTSGDDAAEFDTIPLEEIADEPDTAIEWGASGDDPTEFDAIPAEDTISIEKADKPEEEWVIPPHSQDSPLDAVPATMPPSSEAEIPPSSPVTVSTWRQWQTWAGVAAVLGIMAGLVWWFFSWKDRPPVAQNQTFTQITSTPSPSHLPLATVPDTGMATPSSNDTPDTALVNGQAEPPAPVVDSQPSPTKTEPAPPAPEKPAPTPSPTPPPKPKEPGVFTNEDIAGLGVENFDAEEWAHRTENQPGRKVITVDDLEAYAEPRPESSPPEDPPVPDQPVEADDPLKPALAFEQFLIAGDKAFDAGDFRNAKLNYEAALEFSPNNRYLMDLIAKCEAKLQPPPEVEAKPEAPAPSNEQTETGGISNPVQMFETYLNQADQAFANGDYERAKRHYQAAEQFSPHNQYIAQRLKACEEKLKTRAGNEPATPTPPVVEPDPANPLQMFESYLNKAETAFAQGDYEQAKDFFEAAEAYSPGNQYLTQRIEECDQWLKHPHFSDVEFVTIPGGTYQMGDLWGDTQGVEQVHTVTVDDFQIGKYEVTNAQYAAFLNEYGSDTVLSGPYRGKKMIYPFEPGLIQVGNKWMAQKGYEQHPVVMVTWYGAHTFCEFYGYRLPTEAEWEFAARERGKKVRFGNGENIARPGQINFNSSPEYRQSYSEFGNNRQKSVPVNTLKPNSLGLYHMSGNVWEWCQDWFSETYYTESESHNPQGPPSGDLRVLRGGSWYSTPDMVRASSRFGRSPDIRSSHTGFRVAKD